MSLAETPAPATPMSARISARLNYRRRLKELRALAAAEPAPKPRAPAPKPKPIPQRLMAAIRRCLTCGQDFESEHCGNRVCGRCKQTVEHRAGGLDVDTMTLAARRTAARPSHA